MGHCDSHALKTIKYRQEINSEGWILGYDH